MMRSSVLAAELLGQLGRMKIKVKHRKWKCFKEAIKSTWNEDALQALVKRLATLRKMVEMHVLVALRYIRPTNTGELVVMTKALIEKR